MTAWPQGISAITLFVEDLERSKQFYSGVFGLPVTFEDDASAVFSFGNTIINLLKATEASEPSILPAWLRPMRDRACSCRSPSKTLTPPARCSPPVGWSC